MDDQISTAAIVVAALGVYALITSLLREYCTRREIALAAVGVILLFGALLFVESRYATGDGESILGVFFPPVVFGLLWGIGLVVICLFAEPPAYEAPPKPDDNSFHTYIKKQLRDFYADMEDPAARGVADARHKGGPFPASTDARPLKGGYEDSLRRRYETMAGVYLQNFITGLLDGLQKSLGVLDRLNKTIEPGWYAQLARNTYKGGAKDIRPEILQAAAQEYKRTGDEKNEFEDSCNLRPGEKIEHFPRTSLRKLAFILLFFGAAEGALGFFLLPEALGQGRLQAAISAVFATIFIGFAMGFFRQWTRRNKGAFTRLAARSAVFLFVLCYAAGLGFVMGYAPGWAEGEDAAAIAQGIFVRLSNGYQTLGAANGLIQFALLAASAAVFSVLAYHISHRFNKFHPRDAFLKQEKKARNRWFSLTEKIEKSGDQAIGTADEACESNQHSAAAAHSAIQTEQKTLSNITKDAASVYRGIFQPQFEEDIRSYREANANARSDIYQPPDYFSDPAPEINFNKIVQEICDTHLNEIPTAPALEQAEENFKHLQEEAKKWERVRPDLLEAFHKFDKEVIAAATMGKEPEHEPWILETIGMGGSPPPPPPGEPTPESA